jgi:hypothetical protein
MDKVCSTTGRNEKCYERFIRRKSERNSRPRYRGKDNSKTLNMIPL